MDGNSTDNTTILLEIDYSELYDYKTAESLWKIFAPFLLILGTAGNILSVVVMSRKTMRQSTTTLYLIILSFSDLVILYTGLLRQWIHVISNTDIRTVSSVSCKLHTLLVYLFSDFSSWLLVAVTLERVVGVCWPHRGKSACTKKMAGIVVSVIFTSLFLLNSHFLYGRGDKIITNGNFTELVKCTNLFSDYQSFASETWPWIDLCFFCLIPFVILLVGNTCIIVKVTSSGRAVRGQVGPVGVSSNRSSKMSSLTAMLLLVNFVFFSCNVPISVYLIGIHNWKTHITHKKYAMLTLVYTSVNILMYLNNAVNFLLYCISGPRFRRELKSLFGGNKIANTTTSYLNNYFQTNNSRVHSIAETVT